MGNILNMKAFLSICLLLLWFTPGWAHFLVLKPSIDISDKRVPVVITAKFTHPMKGAPTMDFEIERSGVAVLNKVFPLKWKTLHDKKARFYQSLFKPPLPGVYQVFVVPKPYFEPFEGRFIKQITKVYLCYMGMEAGWDKPLGLEAEVIPLTRPFGLWEGAVFVGKAVINGKKCSHCVVEIEYLNEEALKVPPVFATQKVITDERGYFYYTLPWAGWWGFSVIGEGKPIVKDGRKYPLELDAVIWIKAYPKPSR